MESISELRRICQRPVIGENGWYVRYFVRKISIYFTKMFLYTPINAHQISLLMTLIGIVGGVFFALGMYINGLIGAMFLQLFLIFDCTDGEVARYRKQSSRKGKYLDYIANDIVHVAMFSGLTVGTLNGRYSLPAFLSSHGSIIILCGIGAITSPLLYKIAVYHAKELCGEFIVLSDSFLAHKKEAFLKSFLQSIIYPITIINIATVCAVFGLLPFVLIAYGTILPLSWILSTALRFRNL